MENENIPKELDPKIPLRVHVENELDRMGRRAVTCIGNTVFLRQNGKVLLIKHDKPDNPTFGKYVGLGGKVKQDTYFKKAHSEKVDSRIFMTSLMSNDFNLSEEMPDATTREIKEEIGAHIQKERLIPIGSSQVKVVNTRAYQTWGIAYYIYDMKEEEMDLSSFKGKRIEEGEFLLVPEGDLEKIDLFFADQILFKNKDSNIHVEAIYDDLENIHKLRLLKEGQSIQEDMYILVPNYMEPAKYVGQTVKVDREHDDENSIIQSYKKAQSLCPNADYDYLFESARERIVLKTFHYPEHSELFPEGWVSKKTKQK